MRCHFCDQDKEGLPFRCNYCGETFCVDHRLPENHACPRIGGPLQPGYTRRYQPAKLPARSREVRTFPSLRSGPRSLRLQYSGLFSRVESRHMLLATGAMTLAGVFLAFYTSAQFAIFGAQSWLLLFLIPAYIVSFVGHELAHKFLAQANGLWAEFRTNAFGLLMTLVSAVLPIPFKFLAPGQTNIQGEARKEIVGTIALIGPGFNLVLGFLFFLMSRVIASQWVIFVCVEIAIFNCWIAIFNLIPFGSFDGTRVFEWDKTRWAIVFCATIALTVVAYYLG